MPKPHEPGLLNRLGKTAAPFLARTLMGTPARCVLPMFEIYAAMIQGKGAGTGWDMDGEVRAAASHIRRPNPTLFDVGANRGEWSRRMGERFGYRCRILQFEPSAHCQAVLSQSKMPGAELIAAAVADTSGRAVLYSPHPGSPIASRHPRRDSYFQSDRVLEEEVSVVTLDEVIAQRNIEIVDFLKLDVEGDDFAALQGARSSLAAGRIRALSFEFGSGQINSRTFFHDFWDLLQSHGFVVKRICPGGFLVTIEEYYEDLEYFRGATNYLAVHRSQVQPS